MECEELFEGNEERLLCLNPDYVGWQLTSDDYAKVPALKGIIVASTAYDWIDGTLAEKNNVPICNIRNFSSQAVAEWAIAMMFNLARQTPRLIKDEFPLDFDKDFLKYGGIQLKGKSVGIIGLGHIGSAIAEACEGLGMQVRYWSRSDKDSSYEYASLDELLKTSDIIFPTMARNDSTQTMLTHDKLDLIQSSAILVSIVHGLFDEAYVLEMVRNNTLFGFGFEAAPASFENYEGNVWAAPSYAWVTYESMYNSVVEWTDAMVLASKNEYPTRIN
ncbi:MAG: NAD(P)-dependent oxidoreductase [Patescibacteria group bacterium]